MTFILRKGKEDSVKECELCDHCFKWQIHEILKKKKKEYIVREKCVFQTDVIIEFTPEKAI